MHVVAAVLQVAQGAVHAAHARLGLNQIVPISQDTALPERSTAQRVRPRQHTHKSVRASVLLPLVYAHNACIARLSVENSHRHTRHAQRDDPLEQARLVVTVHAVDSKVPEPHVAAQAA